MAGRKRSRREMEAEDEANLEHDLQDWGSQLVSFLKRNGAQKLSVLGSQVPRPASLPKGVQLKKVLEEQEVVKVAMGIAEIVGQQRVVRQKVSHNGRIESLMITVGQPSNASNNSKTWRRARNQGIQLPPSTTYTFFGEAKETNLWGRVVDLKQYGVPVDLQNVVTSNRRPVEVHQELSVKVEEKLGIERPSRLENGRLFLNEPERYLQLQTLLLYCEEINQQILSSDHTLRRTSVEPEDYDGTIENTPFRRIDVTGINKKTMINEEVTIILGKSKKFVARVWYDEYDSLVVHVPKRFPKQRVICDVFFAYSRTPLRLMHRALESPGALIMLQNEFHHRKSFSSGLSDVELGSAWTNIRPTSFQPNPMQCDAIAAIVCVKEKRSPPIAPIVIYGPPGTGKTATMVEAILVLQKEDGNCILACAPSNSAADLLCSRLLEASPDIATKLLRMLGPSRDPYTVPEEVYKVSLYDHQQHQFLLPERDKVQQYRIIVSTNISAGHLVSLGLEQGYFTHIFLDEAGQALGPESMIPVSLGDEQTLVVVAGDPNQLGPIVQAPSAVEFGLETSLLQRMIISRQLASEHTWQGESTFYSWNCSHSVYYLFHTYRSHPAITSVYSACFYDGHLCASADRSVVSDLEHWEGLKTPGVPVIFRHNGGAEARDARSPSWYNASEVDLIRDYVDQLVHNHNVLAEDIGIITPYRRQRDKVLHRLRLLGSDVEHGVSVGTTEQFQGQERKVIIISCVRSNVSHAEGDLSVLNIGFLSNPRRLNVAISQAKSLLIIIGNSQLLSRDVNWHGVLSKIDQLGGYWGPVLAPLPVEPMEANDVAVAQADAAPANPGESEQEANPGQQIAQPAAEELVGSQQLPTDQDEPAPEVPIAPQPSAEPEPNPSIRAVVPSPADIPRIES